MSGRRSKSRTPRSNIKILNKLLKQGVEKIEYIAGSLSIIDPFIVEKAFRTVVLSNKELSDGNLLKDKRNRPNKNQNTTNKATTNSKNREGKQVTNNNHKMITLKNQDVPQLPKRKPYYKDTDRRNTIVYHYVKQHPAEYQCNPNLMHLLTDVNEHLLLDVIEVVKPFDSATKLLSTYHSNHAPSDGSTTQMALPNCFPTN